MNIKRVRYFLALSETLNFTEAARRLSVSQPSLTRGLQRLEEELGATLVRREGKNTHLTPFGASMIDHCRLLDETDRQIERAAKRLVHEPVRSVRVAVMCTIGAHRLTGFIAHFRRMYCDIRIVLCDVAGDVLREHMLDGQFDCALASSSATDDMQLKSIALYQEPFVVVHSPEHAFCSRDSVSLEEILLEPYLDKSKCEFRNLFVDEGVQLSFHDNCAVLSDREDWIQTMVRASVGVTILPVDSVVIDGLATTSIEPGEFTRSVSLVIPRGREDTPPIEAFMRAAREYDWTLSAIQSLDDVARL